MDIVKEFYTGWYKMTDPPKRMGRPRTYDRDTALEQARQVFWDAGYASSSLDALGAAMAMSRPSLYGAFGDKEALYGQPCSAIGTRAWRCCARRSIRGGRCGKASPCS